MYAAAFLTVLAFVVILLAVLLILLVCKKFAGDECAPAIFAIVFLGAALLAGLSQEIIKRLDRLEPPVAETSQ